MVVQDFFRFYGHNKFTFATRPDENVTLILGANGIGKTTLLNAFKWCFYGDVEEPLTTERMLNRKKANEMAPGQRHTSYVEIKFEEKGLTYYIKRSQDFYKIGDEVRKTREPQLQVRSVDYITGNTIYIDEPTFFERIIPEKLSGFFFFNGEEIDRLAQVDGREDIRKAILDILGLTTIEKTSKDLEAIRQDYNKDLSKFQKQQDPLFIENYNSLLAKKESKENELASLKEYISDAEKELREIDAVLNQSNAATVKEKVKRRAAFEEEVKQLKNQLENNRKNHLNHISRKFAMLLIAPVLDSSFKSLEDKRERGELPSDIKLQFIDDLIERGNCICQRSLEVNSSAYEAVLEMRNRAGRTELDNAYTRLTSLIKSAKEQNRNFFNEHVEFKKIEQDLENRISNRMEELRQISNELKKTPEEKIQRLEETRQTLRTLHNERIEQKGSLNNEIRVIQKDIEDIEKKLNAQSFAEEKAKTLLKQIDKVKELEKINKEIQQKFIAGTREELDKKIKEVYKQFAWKKYRQPVLTNNFELKMEAITMNGERDIESASTGEGQITSLSFIGSLVSYSREKVETDLVSAFGGGDFPIVMDSPFGQLDEKHRANVAKGIGHLASQVIVVVSNAQWSSDVSDNLEVRVGKKYLMLEGSSEESMDGEFTKVEEVF